MLKDEIFLDQKNKKHILTKETQEQWLKTFSLENLEQSYIPKHSKEIKEALGGKEIKLTKGSLLKLVERDREQYIQEIKETIDKPELIMKDKDEIILAREHNNKAYFTSIGKDYETHFTIISNAPKKITTIQNKLENGAEILYQSSKFENLRYNQTFTDERLITNKIDMLDYNEKNMKSQATQGEKAMDMLRQEHEEKDIDKEKEFNRNKINRFGGKKK